MKHLAIYMTEFASGGVQRMNLNLAPEFLAAGFKVTFIVHSRTGALADKIPVGVEVVDLEADRARHAIAPLARYLRKHRPDVLVASLGQPNLIALCANRLAGRPSKVIVSQRNHLSSQARAMGTWQYRLLPLLYRLFLKHADAILCVSEGLVDDLMEVTGLPRNRFTVIYNPAVPQDVAERASEPADHKWFDDDLPVILAIGRLVGMKDYPTMLRALALVPDARLIILGEGDLRASLQQLAVELGISERVAFAGFVGNPFPFLAAADLFLLTSEHEGFGNVVAEALACGTPVVSTDCPSGPGEILDWGKYGKLAPVGDAQGLADAVRQSLAAPPEKALLMARGMEFSVASAAASYIGLFDELAAQSQA